MLSHAELAHQARDAYKDADIHIRGDIELLVQDHGANVVVISIRGSELDPNDWLRNLTTFPWWFSAVGKAPFGYGHGAERIIERLILGWSGALVNKSIYVTGHSAGAAMGICVAQGLKKYGYNVVECVAFGTPRTGKRKLMVPTTIYDHDNDPVLCVPWFWKHPVEPVMLDDVSNGMYQHSMDHYLTALEQLERSNEV